MSRTKNYSLTSARPYQASRIDEQLFINPVRSYIRRLRCHPHFVSYDNLVCESTSLTAGGEQEIQPSPNPPKQDRRARGVNGQLPFGAARFLTVSLAFSACGAPLDLALTPNPDSRYSDSHHTKEVVSFDRICHALTERTRSFDAPPSVFGGGTTEVPQRCYGTSVKYKRPVPLDKAQHIFNVPNWPVIPR